MASLSRAKRYLSTAKSTPVTADKIDALIQALEEVIKIVSDVEDTAERADKNARR